MANRPSRKKHSYRRLDHYRWLRSDGMPNFNDKVFSYLGELHIMAKRDVRYVHPSTSVMKAVEEMAQHYRSLLVLSPSGKTLTGVITAMDVVNYMGGGELFMIIEKRHGYSIYSALNNEVVETIMERNPVFAYVDEDLKSALAKMVMHGVGILPVVERDGSVHGIITEHDLVSYLVGVVSLGLKARDYMSKPVITVDKDSSLKEVMETMVKYGFRRLPIVEDNVLVGLITAIDIVRLFGKHEVFEHMSSDDIRDLLVQPVHKYMVTDIVVAMPEDDLAKVVREMFSRDVSSALIIDENGVLQGIITERDILYALLTPV
ncbi:MAG: CBS domain-containing protein [Desulfurococcaceae archaeon]